MILPRNLLQRRGSPNNSYLWMIFVGIAAGLLVLIICYGAVRQRRFKSATPPGYLPTKYLRQKWQAWQPKNTYAVSGRRNPAPAPSAARASSVVPTSSIGEPSRTEADFANNRLSVRSIVTLPPYRVAPLPSERLIAREGERAGVDTVLEYPESDTEVEARREEEMETLYTIREARRREQSEREERRQARREAREQGDWVRLEQLEAESRARQRGRTNSDTPPTAPAVAVVNEHSRRPSDTSSFTHPNPVANRSQQDSSLLIAELNSLREHNARARRVSSVSYADLGVARHDGSRMRADSIDSDHRPLLDSAASISRSRATSRASSIRDGSRSRSRATRSRDGHDRRPSMSESRGSSYFLTPQSSGDLPPNPPSYEDDVSIHGGELGEAPPYSSPVLERNPQLPAPRRPAHVSAPGTVERAASPNRGEAQRSDRDAMSRPEGDEDFKPALSERGAPELPPLRLERTQESVTPSIEVVHATPISEVPPASRGGRFGLG
ncbi:MAG: hypothetical protein LQ340_006088 [Diploschistes diacapsis]|nr:MAG: hypothetical protein LQ340_006088 [Diploschistes diacapsis]